MKRNPTDRFGRVVQPGSGILPFFLIGVTVGLMASASLSAEGRSHLFGR